MGWSKVSEETARSVTNKCLPLRNHLRSLGGMEEFMASSKRDQVLPGGGGHQPAPLKGLESPSWRGAHAGQEPRCGL